MRKTTTALLAPLAALAVAGTVGAGAAQAQAPHDGHAGHHCPPAATVDTSPEASTALTDAGVKLDAVDPATSTPQKDGTTELTFPLAAPGGDETATSSSDGQTPPSELDFDGGVSFTGADGTTSEWDSPTVSTSDGTVTVDIDGQQVDVLQATPASEDDVTSGAQADHGDPHAYDLDLTADGADALNQVTGDDSFSEGDVLASTVPGHHGAGFGGHGEMAAALG